MAHGRRRWRRRNGLLFVTGGSGYLGRHLLQSEASERWAIIAPGSASLDIRRREPVLDAIRDWKPTAIAHLAYRKDDRRTIVDGSANVAEAAAAVGARLVHVSTDIVFGGRMAPYTETDTPDPRTDYGRYKLEAEQAVAARCPDAVIVRTSLLCGTGDLSAAQLEVLDVLAGRRSITYFTDEIRSAVHVDDVADAVAALARRRDVSGPLHVAGPVPHSRAELARWTAGLVGRDASALPTSTIAESGLMRPARVVLDSSRAVALGLRLRPVG